MEGEPPEEIMAGVELNGRFHSNRITAMGAGSGRPTPPGCISTRPLGSTPGTSADSAREAWRTATVAAHLAVAAEHAGHGPAVVIDTDPQQTLATWWKVREAEVPKLAPVSLPELPDKLEALAQLGFSYCFIDTPPALTEQNRRVLRLADLVLIPTRPSPNDLWSLGATLDIVKQAGPPFVFVLTQAKSNARINVQTIAALSEYGQIFQSVIHDRVDYAASMTDGRTALEISPNGRAAAEAIALWEITRGHLEELAKGHA